MYRFLIAFILSCASVFSEMKTVELVANYPVDCALYTQILEKKNCPASVITSDLTHYGKNLKKPNSAFAKFMRRWSLDFWNTVPVKNDVLKIVFFNMSNRMRRSYDLSLLPKEKMVLFIWEPQVVLSQIYKERVTRHFSKVYTWNDDLVDGVHFFKFYYPVLQPMISSLPSFEEKKLCTFMGSNRKSRNEHSLYQERQKAIAFFEGEGEEGFEFYGPGWDPSAFKSYRGPVADKIGTIKNYRFVICYENSKGENGYISEKIFDCFTAGTVPIYWGAPNVEEYIPKGCFIDRRDFVTMDDLYVFLKQMKKEEYEGYLERIRAYLDSEKAQLFSKRHFNEIFHQAVAG